MKWKAGICFSSVVILSACTSQTDKIQEADDAIRENYKLMEENEYQRGQEKLEELLKSDTIENPYKFVPPPQAPDK